MREILLKMISRQRLDRSSIIRINQQMASHLAQIWQWEPFLLPTWDSPISMDNNLELAGRYFFFGNLLNFGFAAENEHAGPVGDIRFWLRLRSNPQILDINNLITFSFEQFEQVFGSFTYPLERVQILRESAQILRRMYNGKVSELYEANHWNCYEILDALAKYFPAFQDSPRGIPFSRRATLALFMTHGRFQESNLFSQLGALPVGADSQVFNGLLQLGVLEVESEVLESLQNGLISEEMLLSLRAFTIIASETLLAEVNHLRKTKIESYHLDYILRMRGTNGRTPVSLGQNRTF
ncbi:MAG TPA: queuosine salvage family protein [Candidatus Deferrimicrobium sp.]|nr:queuosine salvage family protein [Candidatus Deferrimicrobium sp.]